MAKKKISLSETKSVVSNKGVPTDKVMKTPINKTEDKPIHAKVPPKIKRMTFADKKKFLELYDSGAHYNTYNAYLGVTKGDLEWLVNNVDDIRKAVSKTDLKKQRRVEAAKIEMTKAKNVEKVGNASKKWKVAKGKESLFKRQNAIYSCIKMAEIYGVSIKDIERESKRICK